MDKNAIINKVGESAWSANLKNGFLRIRLIKSEPKNIIENIIIPTKNASTNEYLITFLISRNLPSASLSDIILEIAAGKDYEDKIRNKE